MDLTIRIQHKTKNGIYLSYMKVFEEEEIEGLIRSLMNAGGFDYDPNSYRLDLLGFELMPHFKRIQDVKAYLGD